VCCWTVWHTMFSLAEADWAAGAETAMWSTPCRAERLQPRAWWSSACDAEAGQDVQLARRRVPACRVVHASEPV
jgi:hypothetical protein